MIYRLFGKTGMTVSWLGFGNYVNNVKEIKE